MREFDSYYELFTKTVIRVKFCILNIDYLSNKFNFKNKVIDISFIKKYINIEQNFILFHLYSNLYMLTNITKTSSLISKEK